MIRSPFLLLAILALPSVVAPALRAQEPGAAKIRHDATTMILPAGSMPMKDVVDATATFLKINILCDDLTAAGQGRPIVLQTPMMLERAKAEEAVCDLVFANGFVLAPRDADKGLYELISMQGPRAREVMQLAPKRSVEQILSRPTLKQPVTTVVTLQNINTVIATNAMRPFFAQAGRAPGGAGGLTFGTGGDNQSMLLSGMQNEVANAIAMLREIDAAKDAKPEAAPAADVAAPEQPLLRRIAELEQAVQQLRSEVAELKKRLADSK